MARDQAQKEANQGNQSEMGLTPRTPVAVASAETSTMATNSVGTSTSTAQTGVALSPVAVTPVASSANPPLIGSGSSAAPGAQSSVPSAVTVQTPMVTATPLPPAVSGTTGIPSANTASVYVFVLRFLFTRFCWFLHVKV